MWTGTTRSPGAVTAAAPSGAAVWTAPTLDPDNNTIYIVTGDSYSDPAAPESDAVMALEMDTGKIKWKVPLGEYPELTARGIPPTGTENYGGPLVTAGGLIFIGATADETFRVFDKETGDILWKAKLPFGGNASPSTYMVNGRQYVVISAGGGKSGRPSGGTLVAFALPN